VRCPQAVRGQVGLSKNTRLVPLKLGELVEKVQYHKRRRISPDDAMPPPLTTPGQPGVAQFNDRTYNFVGQDRPGMVSVGYPDKVSLLTWCYHTITAVDLCLVVAFLVSRCLSCACSREKWAMGVALDPIIMQDSRIRPPSVPPSAKLTFPPPLPRCSTTVSAR
jgi:hypothetical protein